MRKTDARALESPGVGRAKGNSQVSSLASSGYSLELRENEEVMTVTFL